MVRDLTMNKEFKYKSEPFVAILKSLVSEEKDKYLALASADEIRSFVPEVDAGKNVDLLPVAFNAAVVNRVNKNGDVIDTNTAIASYKNFINKPINIEHNRQKIVGVILAAGFSEFGSDKPLTEDQAKELKGPFNITLGGVVWKIASENLADLIEESNDPTSDKYQQVSASWELGFNDFNLIVIEGESKNIEDGMEVTGEQDSFDAMKKSLKAFGGSGKLDKDKSVYRKVMGSVVPLGIGLTENPAADVKGVVVNEQQNTQAQENVQENFSKTENLDVNSDIGKNVMKLTSIKDITDENLKQATASQISDLIEQELKVASEKYSSEKSKIQTELDSTLENIKTLQASQDKLQQELADMKQKLALAEEEKAKIVAQERFNERMSAFDAEYDLDADTRQVLASDIAGLDDDAFAVFKNKMAIFLKNKKKGQKTDDNSKQDKGESKASVETVVEEIADKGEKSKTAFANTSSASEGSLFEKYKNAFDYDNFVVTNK